MHSDNSSNPSNPSNPSNISSYLESHGWTRKIAGDADFDNAVAAIKLMHETGRGLVVSGEYGVGKTKLCEIVAEFFGGAFRVNLGIPDELDKLTPQWQDYYATNPYAMNVFLDDLGAESTMNEYGIKHEIAAEFIIRYYAYHRPGTRMIMSTNYRTDEFDTRYNGRTISRTKEQSVALRLTGGDKRRWLLPNGKEAL